VIEDTCTFAQDVDDGCMLAVRVRPGAKKNDVAGIHAGAVKISLTAPPVDGRANEDLIEFIAELLRIPRAHLDPYWRNEPHETAAHYGKERG
jgi:uncharacterized protein (TIGR00251 family)